MKHLPLALISILGLPAALLALETEAEKPARNPDAAARIAVETYTQSIAEIERIASKHKAEALTRLKRSLDESEKLQKEGGQRYQGMLGAYFLESGAIPFTHLSVPNGESLFNAHVRGLMNGKVDLSKDLAKFTASGHLIIPKTGKYILETGREGTVTLNGVGYSLERVEDNRRSAIVELPEGVYSIGFEIGNNGGQLAGGKLRVADAQTETDLVIFFYASELDAFLNDTAHGVELTETSNWNRKTARIKPTEKTE